MSRREGDARECGGSCTVELAAVFSMVLFLLMVFLLTGIRVHDAAVTQIVGQMLLEEGAPGAEEANAAIGAYLLGRSRASYERDENLLFIKVTSRFSWRDITSLGVLFGARYEVNWYTEQHYRSAVQHTAAFLRAARAAGTLTEGD